MKHYPLIVVRLSDVLLRDYGEEVKTLRINLLPPYVTKAERVYVRACLTETGQLLTHNKDLARAWPRLLDDCILVVWWPDRWCEDWRLMFGEVEVMPYNYYRSKIPAVASAGIATNATLR